ncbi:hypothetical protein P4594_04685 [Priestia megaterium]|uniref:hypothetical protein n=1 Tax=Priestia megaterium TaxID=1404 RepID=UPI002E1DA31A|nr:hypothetical protein [Priestia megaterium]
MLTQAVDNNIFITCEVENEVDTNEQTERVSYLTALIIKPCERHGGKVLIEQELIKRTASLENGKKQEG